MEPFKDIRCVVEPVEACKPALERAATLAKNNHACLTVVSVIDRVAGVPCSRSSRPASQRRLHWRVEFS